VNLSVSNWHLSLKLFVIAAVMFGFGYAMIPLYRAICEITGVGLITQRDEDAAEFARNTQVDTSRKVTIEFDANSRGTWQFKPKVSSVSVNPGELVTSRLSVDQHRGPAHRRAGHSQLRASGGQPVLPQARVFLLQAAGAPAQRSA
jgi:cytochrome c oxidase assembly protein Cox11